MPENLYGSTDAPPPLVVPNMDTNGGGAVDSPASVADRATDTVEAGKQAVTEVALTATEQAKDVAQQAKKQARDLAGEARGQLNEQVGAQHRSLIDGLRTLADELSGMAGRTDDGGLATDLVGQAGDRAQSAAEWLDRHQPGDLLGEVRSFAQLRPGTFLLGAAAAGVFAGRLTSGVLAMRSEVTDSGTTAQLSANGGISS